ncbi:hypothetical protein BDV95DRAFT_621071 [Massariosphaeria phaeospora]|uniref:BTB domain-containing protein n=1 Tax=Massariosphaeria phaeospora TaxID=100035 RepID=A0A7C8M5H8_9PLEO|nr:hypothetical protein BDV95DRAFT_621071 [Massariosphaeria phaeospora]
MISTKDVRVPAASIAGALQTTPIKITVGTGDGQKAFFIHQGFLCKRSDFFKNALNGPWLESNERSINLPEDDPATFLLYQELLYTHVLPVKPATLDMEACNEDDYEKACADAEYIALGQLYVLVEKLIDEQAKSSVLAALLARTKQVSATGKTHYPGLNCVQIIYEGTPLGSPARATLISIYNEHGDQSFLNDRYEIPKDFFYDLSYAVLGRTRKKDMDEVLSKKDFNFNLQLRLKDAEIRRKTCMIENLENREPSSPDEIYGNYAGDYFDA